MLLTMQGERRVDALAIGDRVITRDSGVATIRSVSVQRASAHSIRLRAGSLGHTRPDRDVLLPSGQPVLVRDWRAPAMFGARQAMVPVHRLRDDEFVTDAGTRDMTLHTLYFDAPHILYVDGLELASDAEAAARAAQQAA